MKAGRRVLSVVAMWCALTCAAMAAPALTLEQAIALGQKTQLPVLLAAAQQAEAEGFAEQARAVLMPQVSVAVSQSRGNANLRAQGIDFPGLPIVTDPFDTFDARLRMVQTLFNLSAWRLRDAAATGEALAKKQVELVREQVAAAVATAYIEMLRADQSMAAAQASLKLAQALAKLATDQKQVGIASGIDVARAATRVAQSQLMVIQASSVQQQAAIRLQRLMGTTQAQLPVLAGQLPEPATVLPTLESALSLAQTHRVELQVADLVQQTAQQKKRAADAARWPTVALVADYGLSGNEPDRNEAGTYRYGIRIEAPLFDGGLIRGRIATAASEYSQTEARSQDIRGQVATDVRLTMVAVQTSLQRVDATKLERGLAERELALARDRFSAGAANNIEILNAQTALAHAEQEQIDAIAAFHQARVNLAAACGQAVSFRL